MPPTNARESIDLLAHQAVAISSYAFDGNGVRAQACDKAIALCCTVGTARHEREGENSESLHQSMSV
jgi:hypothetical protein